MGAGEPRDLKFVFVEREKILSIGSVIVQAGVDQDGNFCKPFVPDEPLQYIGAGHVRHFEIEDDQIDGVLGEIIEGFQTIARDCECEAHGVKN